MSVKIREWLNGKGWEYDINYRHPDGTPDRERRKAPVGSKSAAQRWAEQRERELVLDGSQRPKPATVEASSRKEVPTLSNFAPRFIEGYARAERRSCSCSFAWLIRSYVSRPIRESLKCVATLFLSTMDGLVDAVISRIRLPFRTSPAPEF